MCIGCEQVLAIFAWHRDTPVSIVVRLTYLIQNPKTREYFHKGTWTLDSGWAESFSDPAQVITACLRHELRNVELILQFGFELGRTCSLNLSLPERLLFDQTETKLLH
jgi:hypothetical protein